MSRNAVDDRLEVNPQISFGSLLERVAPIAKAPEDHAASCGFSFDSAVVRGGVTVPGHSFDIENTRVSLDNVTWSSAGGTVNIQACLFADCHWHIHSRGRINVSGASDKAVTAGTWRKTAADLKLDTTGRPEEIVPRWHERRATWSQTAFSQ